LPSPRAEGPAGLNGLHRYRLLFAKTDQARFLGHLEMVTALLRAMRRAGLPLVYTQGHHPAPRLSLGDALPLGIESRDEVVEIILREHLQPHEVGRRLNGELPPGLAILEVREDGAGRKSLGRRLVTYEAAFAGRVWPAEGLRRFQERDLAPFQQKTKRGMVLIPLEEKLRAMELLGPDRLRCILEQGPECTVRIREALAHIFGLSGEEVLAARITKVSSRNLEGEQDAL
jgi:radical SAM-linked protein